MLKIRSLMLTFMLICCMATLHAKHYTVSATAIFKNEARFLREWIEYHQLIGVEHFYLYNNNSSDNFQQILAPYILMGIVELFNWSKTYETTQEWTDIQCSAYKDAVDRSKHKTKWLAILDIDEYIVPVQHNKLSQVLKEFEKFGGVCVNWQMYGTSYVSKIGPSELLTEKLVYKAETQYGENAFVKSIVRPSRVRDITDPHFVRYKHGYFQVNTNKEQTANAISQIILTDKLRINHYWTKDEEFFNTVKIGRREAWTEGYQNIMTRAGNLNQVHDNIMSRFVPHLRKRMGL